MVEHDYRPSMDESDVVQVRCGQQQHESLLAAEGERSEPTKRESFALQLANRRTQAFRQGDRRRFIELWDVRLDEVGRRVSRRHRETVGPRAPRGIAGNPTTR